MNNSHNCIRQKNRMPEVSEIKLPRNIGISRNLRNEIQL